MRVIDILLEVIHNKSIKIQAITQLRASYLTIIFLNTSINSVCIVWLKCKKLLIMPCNHKLCIICLDSIIRYKILKTKPLIAHIVDNKLIYI